MPFTFIDKGKQQDSFLECHLRKFTAFVNNAVLLAPAFGTPLLFLAVAFTYLVSQTLPLSHFGEKKYCSFFPSKHILCISFWHGPVTLVRKSHSKKAVFCGSICIKLRKSPVPFILFHNTQF